jgi:hypothetical protein
MALNHARRKTAFRLPFCCDVLNPLGSERCSFNRPTARDPNAGPPHDYNPPDLMDSSWMCSCGWLATLTWSHLELEYHRRVLLCIVLWIHRQLNHASSLGVVGSQLVMDMYVFLLCNVLNPSGSERSSFNRWTAYLAPRSFSMTTAMHPNASPPRDFNPPGLTDSWWMTCYPSLSVHGRVLVCIELWIHQQGVVNVNIFSAEIIVIAYPKKGQNLILA